MGDAPGVLLLQLGALELDLNDVDSTGFLISQVDLGNPTPRAVSIDLPGQDGTDDQTAYFSSRTVQLSGSIVPNSAGDSRSKAFDTLAPFLAPSARPTLLYALDDDVAERALGLRVSQWTNPIDHPDNATAFSVQWVCPDPIAYSVNDDTVSVGVAGSSSSGFSFPIVFPLSFGALGSGGDTELDSPGTYQTWPILRFFGPATNPVLAWIDPVSGDPSGPRVAFSGITIADGDYIEVNTRDRTALLNGLAGASRYAFIDFTNTTWGPLQPGENQLRLSATGTGADTRCDVIWRDAFL